MNVKWAKNIADLCEFENVDNKYYCIFERHKSGGLSCVGVVQHFMSAVNFAQGIELTYEYAEIVDRPSIEICPFTDDSYLIQLMLVSLFENRKETFL
jgi:hypothetical protein